MDIIFFTLALAGGFGLLGLFAKIFLCPHECITNEERERRQELQRQQQQQRAGPRVQTISQQIVQVDPSKGILFVTVMRRIIILDRIRIIFVFQIQQNTNTNNICFSKSNECEY